MDLESASNLGGTTAHLTGDLEPIATHVPGTQGRHGSSLCSGRRGIIQVFDQVFMDAYPPRAGRRCIIAELPLCTFCVRLRDAAHHGRPPAPGRPVGQADRP